MGLIAYANHSQISSRQYRRQILLDKDRRGAGDEPMPVPRATLDAIKRANDLVEVAREHAVPLRRRGRTYFGRCPFHAERTPSFGVSRDAGLFHCFGCGVGGDVIRFVERIERVSFPEAVARLARRAGIALETRPVA